MSKAVNWIAGIFIGLLAIGAGYIVLGNSYPPAKGPFLMVQVCLEKKENLPVFASQMRSIAQQEKMEFLDDSAERQREFKVTGAIPKDTPSGSMIHVYIEGHDGWSMSGGNLGLPKYQMAVGFIEGEAGLDEGRHVADRFVEEFKKHWHIEPVPAGRGAMMMENCPRVD